jgi:hypothetical protein
MLTISPGVMSAFEHSSKDRFVASAIDHASRFDPDFGALDPAAKRSAVLDTIDVAAGFGVFGKLGVIYFLEARCALGLRFPEDADHDWARDLLSSDWTDETRLMEYVRDTALEKAGARHV